MANKRWTENEPLQKFDNFVFPVTDMNEGAGGVDKQAGVTQFKKMIETTVLNGVTLPTCKSFNDPEYLKPSYWNFANISNTEDKPDNLAEHQVGFAHLEVVAGTDEAQSMGAKNYVVQKLTYVDITANTIRENFRGVLLTDEGAFSNTTGWHCSTDSSDIALTLSQGATMNGELVAGQNWVSGEINTLKTGLEDGTTVVAKSTNADVATNAGYSGNSAMLGGVIASKYALKADIPAGLSEQKILDIAHPIDSGYTPVADETPMQLFNGDTFKSWWNETSKGSNKYQRVRQEDFRVPQIDTLGSGRNLVTVLKASSVQDAFAKLKQRVLSRDYSGLMLGDYLDIPSINTGSRSGAGTIQNNSSWNNLRVEIAGSDFYDYGKTLSNHGILFVFKNIVYKHRMNPTNDNTGGYLASELYPIINEDFTAGLTEAIGFEPKEIHRSLDNGYGSSTVNWSTEKVFIPTEMEMFGNWTYGMTTKPKHINLQNIQQFPIYQKRGGNSGRVKNFEGSTWYYWESSSYKDSSTLFARVNDDGSASGTSASYTYYGVSPAFYIG